MFNPFENVPISKSIQKLYQEKIQKERLSLVTNFDIEKPFLDFLNGLIAEDILRCYKDFSGEHNGFYLENHTEAYVLLLKGEYKQKSLSLGYLIIRSKKNPFIGEKKWCVNPFWEDSTTVKGETLSTFLGLHRTEENDIHTILSEILELDHFMDTYAKESSEDMLPKK